MSRLRIRCKREDFVPGAFAGIVPSFPDLVVEYVDREGKVTELTNVQAVRFEVEASAEPARAIVTFVDVELDVETVVDTQAGLLVEQLAGLVPDEPGGQL